MAAAWAVLLVLSFCYWSWVATIVHDGKGIRAALIYFAFLAGGVGALLAKIFRLTSRP